MSVRYVEDEHRRRLLVSRHVLGPDGRAKRAIEEAVGALALVHSTDPATPHLSIAARTGASAAAVDTWFYDDRSMLRHTTIRRTIFVTPLDVVPLAHGAVNGVLVPKFREGLLAWIDASPDTSEPADRFLDDVERSVVRVLRARGATTGAALAEVVPGLRVTFDPAPGKSYSKPIRITSRVLELLAVEGRIARGRPTGRDFTSSSWTWEVIEEWLGPAGIEAIEPEEALRGLLLRYLVAFGPATITDLAWWTGVAKRRVRAAMTSVGAVEVTLDGRDGVGFVAPDDDLDAPAPEGVVALLPGLDSTTMGWKQRGWYVDDRPEAGLFDRNGNAGPTVWLDGRVVGAWIQRADGEIVTSLAADVGKAEQAAIEAEADRLRAWLDGVRVRSRFPTVLTERLMEA